MVGDVNGGKSLKDIAAAHKLTMTTSQPLARTGDAPTAPPSLIAALFGAKPNGAVSAAAGDNVVVAQLKTIQPADPAQDQAGVKQLTDQLSASMKSRHARRFTSDLARDTSRSRSTRPISITCSDLPSMEISPAFEEFERRRGSDKPVLVWTDLIADLDTPVSAMMKLADGQPMSFLFESVEGGERIGRYSIIGMKPDLIWRCFRNEAQINRRALDNPSAFAKAEQSCARFLARADRRMPRRE